VAKPNPSGRTAAHARAPSPRPESRSATPWWATSRGAAILVTILAVLAYARALGNELTYDEDLVLARAAPFLQSWDFGALISKRYFSSSFEGTWRPFCTLTYMVDAALSMQPLTFKLDDLLWHIAAANLVMALARRLLPEGWRRYAIVTGLLFAVHPVTTETVDNASFREDALVTVLTLATLLLALDRRPWWSLGAFGLGFLSKESAVVAPALLALLRLGRLGDPLAPRPTLRSLTRELAPYGVVTLAYLAIRFGPLATPIAYAQYPGGSFSAALAGLPAIWTHDLRLLVAPWPLCADLTGAFRFGGQPPLQLAGALAVVGGYVALMVVAARRGERALAFGLAWFLVALLPVSNLLPMPIPAAERFLYLPLAGIAIAASAVVGVAAERMGPRARKVGVAVGTAALAVFVVLTNLRHADWKDDEALWRATVAVNPSSCGAQSAVGGRLLSLGMASHDPAQLREAATRQERALALCPESTDAFRAAMFYTRLGGARALLDDRPAAQQALLRAAQLAPKYALPFVWLGYLAHLQADQETAAEMLRHAVIDLGPPDGAVADVARLYVDSL
jgi:hypothetical protein